MLCGRRLSCEGPAADGVVTWKTYLERGLQCSEQTLSQIFVRGGRVQRQCTKTAVPDNDRQGLPGELPAPLFGAACVAGHWAWRLSFVDRNSSQIPLADLARLGPLPRQRSVTL